MGVKPEPDRYTKALNYLVPKSGSDTPKSSSKEQEAALAYLTTINSKTGTTPVDDYVKRQQAWANAKMAWEEARSQAQGELAAFWIKIPRHF